MNLLMIKEIAKKVKSVKVFKNLKRKQLKYGYVKILNDLNYSCFNICDYIDHNQRIKIRITNKIQTYIADTLINIIKLNVCADRKPEPNYITKKDERTYLIPYIIEQNKI